MLLCYRTIPYGTKCTSPQSVAQYRLSGAPITNGDIARGDVSWDELSPINKFRFRRVYATERTLGLSETIKLLLGMKVG